MPMIRSSLRVLARGWRAIVSLGLLIAVLGISARAGAQDLLPEPISEETLNQICERFDLAHENRDRAVESFERYRERYAQTHDRLLTPVAAAVQRINKGFGFVESSAWGDLFSSRTRSMNELWAIDTAFIDELATMSRFDEDERSRRRTLAIAIRTKEFYFLDLLGPKHERSVDLTTIVREMVDDHVLNEEAAGRLKSTLDAYELALADSIRHEHDAGMQYLHAIERTLEGVVMPDLRARVDPGQPHPAEVVIMEVLAQRHRDLERVRSATLAIGDVNRTYLANLANVLDAQGLESARATLIHRYRCEAFPEIITPVDAFDLKLGEHMRTANSEVKEKVGELRMRYRVERDRIIEEGIEAARDFDRHGPYLEMTAEADEMNAKALWDQAQQQVKARLTSLQDRMQLEFDALGQ